MDMKKLLEVIQVQRHDFLNHLQVISGFLQLNKPDQIKEYLGQIIYGMREMSQTSRLKIPEVTAALLIGFNEAAKYQIELKLTVDSKMDECAVPGAVAGCVLEDALCCFFENFSLPESNDRGLTVKFAENREKYIICFSSRVSSITDPKLLEKDLEPIQALLGQHGGESTRAISGNDLEIFFEFPRGRVENGQTKG